MERLRAASALLVASLILAPTRAAQATAYAYIPGGEGNVVSRMNLDTNEAVPITVGDAPVGVGGSADGSVVVVTNQTAAGTASVIDGTTATVRWTVPVGSYPRGVAVTPDGTKAFVASQVDQTISVIDTEAGVVTGTIPVAGQMLGMAMSPGGQRAYVANASFGGTVLVLDTASDVVVTESLVSETSYVYEVAASDDGTRVYAAIDSAIAIVDTATNLLIDTVPVSEDCCQLVRSVAVSPDGTKVYAGLGYPGGAVEIDVATRTVTPLPRGDEFGETSGVAVSPDGTTLYVINNGNSGTIDLIDVATRTLRATIGALVSSPWVSGDFVVGPTPPVVPPPPPILGSAAQACQKAVLDSFKSFGAKAHQLLSGCLLRVHKDRATGPVTSGTTTACTRDVGPAATSRLAKARALARQRILAGCAATTPAALGPPCAADASTLGELADCVLDRQLDGVADVVTSEIAAACALLDQVGLEGAAPRTCP